MDLAGGGHLKLASRAVGTLQEKICVVFCLYFGILWCHDNCKLDFFHPLKDNFHKLLYLPRVIVVVVAVYEQVPSQVGVEVVLVLPRLCGGGR